MKTSALIMTVTGISLLISGADPAEKAESAKRIKELQTERIAALKEMSDASVNLAKNGRVDVGEACQAKLMHLRAELEAAENDSDRITLCQSIVDEFKQYEELAEARKRGAQGTHLAVLKAKAMRLEAEIAFERAKANAAN